MRYTLPRRSSLSEVTVNPRRLFSAPAIAPRTVWGCQSSAFATSLTETPLLRWSILISLACSVSGRCFPSLAVDRRELRLLGLPRRARFEAVARPLRPGAARVPFPGDPRLRVLAFRVARWPSLTAVSPIPRATSAAGVAHSVKRFPSSSVRQAAPCRAAGAFSKETFADEARQDLGKSPTGQLRGDRVDAAIAALAGGREDVSCVSDSDFIMMSSGVNGKAICLSHHRKARLRPAELWPLDRMRRCH